MEPRRETALVTGGTDGIGKAIARELAKHGSEVLIVGRDRGKGERAADELRASAGHDRVRFLEADLSLVRGARRLAADVIVSVPKLHRLILCAGIVRTQRVLTEEGVESNFSTNYLSRFALTGRLLPLLQAAGTPDAVARILVIGGAAMNGTIHYDDVNLTRHFGIRTVVSQFCQANDLFVIEQARRLAERNKPPRVTITTLKVGVVRTNIRRTFPWWMRMLVGLVFDPLFGHTPEQIAASAMRLLATPEFEGASGRLFTQIKRFKVAEPGARMQDPREGQRLWDFSEHLVASARASGL
jgi:NAD(P)-dependent dehydrogenase (short-subunit alcohol dehydrogenase family)